MTHSQPTWPNAFEVSLAFAEPACRQVWSECQAAEVDRHEVPVGLEIAGAVSLPLAMAAPACQSFVFPAPVWQEPTLDEAATRPDRSAPAPQSAGDQSPEAGSGAPLARGPVNVCGPSNGLATRTRLRPPCDAVKLADRLYYVLQPPLESLIGQGPLELPFRPFPYQLEGVAFLYPSHKAILADEMGLGKSMQAILALRLLLRSGEVRRALLICPKPLVTNWRRELHQWAPEIPVMVIEGDKPRRRWQWQAGHAPLAIANYELLIRDREVFQQPDMHFDLVVLDESQRIKNAHSTTAQVVRSISRTRRWALTGTPVENSPEDLVGIFEFLAPGYLSNKMKLGQMSRLARDYVLRRTKDMVLHDMPPKLFRDAEVELTPAQRDAYDLAENQGILRLSSMGDQATIQHVFELILRLKQICNFDPATGESAKFERLYADLEEVAASGQKAIVFSQWVGTLRTLKDRLRGLQPLEFHGQVPHNQRQQVLQRFQQDPHCHVLLLSYGAGSVGLNLQFASYAFLFDRWWNPAVEDQAINRVHRIGSAGPVTVTRFLALGTIEERINQVLQQKRALFDMLLADTGTLPHRGLSREEIFGLFDLKLAGRSLDAA